MFFFLDDNMIVEFGYGRNGFGPNRFITHNSALILEGCAEDFGTVPDPYLRISNYQCYGKTVEFKVKVNEKKCRYSRGPLQRNDGGFFKTVHQYECYGVEIDLGTEKVEQQVERLLK